MTRYDLAPHWEAVGRWADFNVKENREKMVAAAGSLPPRTMNSSIKAFARGRRPAAG